jgi:hypothetical protein
MGFFNKIAGLYNRVIQSMQDARDVAFNLPAKVEENSRLFKTIFDGDWSDRNINDMEEVVEEVKQLKINLRWARDEDESDTIYMDRVMKTLNSF